MDRPHLGGADPELIRHHWYCELCLILAGRLEEAVDRRVRQLQIAGKTVTVAPVLRLDAYVRSASDQRVGHGTRDAAEQVLRAGMKYHTEQFAAAFAEPVPHRALAALLIEGNQYAAAAEVL